MDFPKSFFFHVGESITFPTMFTDLGNLSLDCSFIVGHIILLYGLSYALLYFIHRQIRWYCVHCWLDIVRKAEDIEKDNSTSNTRKVLVSTCFYMTVDI